MRTRAALQSRTETPDGGGGVVVVWHTERSIWCSIHERSAQERVDAMREQSQVTHEIWARYNSDLTADKRILWNGTVYNIRAVMMPDAMKRNVRILAESGVAT